MQRIVMDIQRQISEEFMVLARWEQVAQQLFSFTPRRAREGGSPRAALDACLEQATGGHARMHWGAPLSPSQEDERWQAVRFQGVYYGVLELLPGYLDSQLLPTLPHQLAQIYALLVALSEHQALVQQLVRFSSPFDDPPARARLSERERDVLIGLILGESEHAMARRLGIAASTVHTHRQHLYHRLDIHGANEAIAWSLALHLVDWLDLPLGSPFVAAP